jgi:hypothetical protein
MAQNGARRGSTNLTIPLMLGAFVLLAGFLYWLSITAEPTAPPVIDEEPVEEVMMNAQLVDATAFETNPDGYLGLTIRLDDVNVAQAIGSKSFFIDLPRTPFLVHMAPELVAAGELMPTAGQPVTVIGDVVAMNDSTVAAWAAAGEFTENDRPLIEFATHYIQALQIGGGNSAPAAAASDTMDSGEGN